MEFYYSIYFLRLVLILTTLIFIYIVVLNWRLIKHNLILFVLKIISNLISLMDKIALKYIFNKKSDEKDMHKLLDELSTEKPFHTNDELKNGYDRKRDNK